MNESTKQKIIRKFLERIESSDNNGVKVSYRVIGGPPGQLLNKKITLAGVGNVELKIWDEGKPERSKQASLRIDPTEIRTLFKKLGSGLDSLQTVLQPIFLPDSLVGSITIEVDNERYTRYFYVNENRQMQDQSITIEMAEAIQKIDSLLQRSGEEK